MRSTHLFWNVEPAEFKKIIKREQVAVRMVCVVGERTGVVVGKRAGHSRGVEGGGFQNKAIKYLEFLHVKRSHILVELVMVVDC